MWLPLLMSLAVLGVSQAGDRPNLEASIQYEWNSLEYRYYTAARKNLYLQDPAFFVKENVMVSPPSHTRRYRILLANRLPHPLQDPLCI